MDKPHSYFSPEVIARIGNLQLRARYVVEGFVSGLHQSPYKGYSLEFAQHRQYAFGDELKHIDWKVYARTDRLYVKQFEQETNLRAYFLLDSSGSMGFKGQKSAMSKFDYGATLVVSLSYLSLRQGDSAGLGYFNDSNAKIIPARNSFSHLNSLLEEIEKTKPQGETRIGKSLETISHSIKKRSLFILFSDLMDDQESVLKAIKFLRYKKNEVWVVHLLDKEEKDFPYSGTIRFDSLENQDKVTLESDVFRKEYEKLLNGFIDSYRVSLRNYGVRYHFHTTDEPIDRVLRAVLSPVVRSNGV